MESGAFDPAFASQLLLEITQERALDQVLRTLVARLLQQPDIARVRIWLIQPGDRCATCPRRNECPSQVRCLQAVASGSATAGIAGGESDATQDLYRRIPLGVSVVGRIAASGQQEVLGGLDQDPGDLAHIPWLVPDGIRGFNGVPIIFRGEILGVIAVFCRVDIPAPARVWGRIFADHVAGAIANARAFEEIERLKRQVEQQNAYLQEEVVEAKAFGDLVGGSAALGQIISQVDLVAPTEASVLILGETGTGKELVAHEIHRRSRRSGRPMIRVNCASIPDELYESEFFGHAKGAFTGAVRDRAGRFDAAEGGTLFLDEVGEIPLALQGKLLRAIQEKRYERVGEDRTRQADVRIVAATNRDLRAEVAAGRFREDLYYRLHVFPIRLPPLRERLDDVVALARHFVALTAQELRCPQPRLTQAVLARLQSYDWPGNVRELRNVIERGVILARGGPLLVDLPDRGATPVTASRQPLPVDTGPRDYLTEADVERQVRDNLERILVRTGWRVKGPGGAAELLGVKPTTLVSRIRKLGLRRP